MYDAAEVARILDILGNRNRRRIIELLRQKPCFVTEISDTLVLSPKAVIEHLQMMEREAILSCQTDERRRKYYFLENDILIDVSLKQVHLVPSVPAHERENERLQQSVSLLGRMIQAHDQILENLQQINQDIESRINDLAENHKDLFRSEREITVIIALSHEPLTFDQIAEVTEVPHQDLAGILKRCEHRGIIGKEEDRYILRGCHAK